MVRVIMIVEVAGSPPEHLTKAIGDHVGGIKQLKDVVVHSINISDPREIEKRDDQGKPTGEMTGMFTCFAEVDIETERFSRITELMFDYMPSSVEVVAPGKVMLDMMEASSLLNNISGRMHRYDEFARAAQFKMKTLNSQLEEAKKLLGKNMPNVEVKKEVVAKKKVAKKAVARKRGVPAKAGKKAAKKKAKKD